MVNAPKPKELAAAAQIAPAYASMILRGIRPAPNRVALVAFRNFGLRLGFLSMLSDADIERLCAERDIHDESVRAAATPDNDAAEPVNVVNTSLQDAV
jgi:hypothetical protein